MNGLSHQLERRFEFAEEDKNLRHLQKMTNSQGVVKLNLEDEVIEDRKDEQYH